MMETRTKKKRKGWPAAVDAEQGILAAAMLEGRLVMPWCISHGFCEETFFEIKHQMVWRVLARLFEVGRDCDELTVMTELEAAGELEMVGGVLYINAMLDRIDTISRFETHGLVVLERWRHRQLIKEEMALREELESAAPFTEVEQAVRERLTAMGELNMVEQEASLEQVSAEGLQRMRDRIAGKVQPWSEDTIFWPWESWNKDFGPLDPHNKNFMCTIGAKTSQGKSSIARDIIIGALKEGKRCVVFLAEGTREDMLDVMAQQASGVSVLNIENDLRTRQEAYLSHREWLDKLVKAKLLLAYEADKTIEKIEARCMQARAQYGRVDLVMIDYLQKVGTDTNFGKAREQQIAYISRKHYDIGKELRCPCIALAQLNKEFNPNKTPDLNCLRESAGIAFDSDTVIIIAWPDKDHKGNEIADPVWRRVRVYQCKKRSGPLANMWMVFYKPASRFLDPEELDAKKKDKEEAVEI